MLGLLALLAPAYATDVLFVEATPATLDDFSVAGLFYGMVVSAAEEEGLSFEDGDAIRAWAGTDADTCWDVDTCPANLWDRTDARLAVVMSVGQTAGGLDVAVRLHGADEAAPFKVFRETVRSGAELAFAETIARAARDALPLLPERKPVGGGPVLVIEDEVIPGPDELPDLDREAPSGREKPDREKPDREKPERTAEIPGDGRPERTKPPKRVSVYRTSQPDDELRTRLGEDEERRRMGVPAGAYRKYVESGMSREEWLAKSRVRAGRGFLELNGGWGLGDVDRGYGVRLRLEDGDEGYTTIGTSSWEGAGAGGAPTFGLTLGYAPAWFLDTSVAVAVQYGQKHLDIGWECAGCDPPATEYAHDPVSAVQAFIEPRLRVYPVATGVVKPYLLVAFSFLLHDAYQVPDSALVDYPDSPAGAAYGPTAGVGIAVDAISRFTIFAEVPGTLLVTPAKVVEEGEVTLAPDTLASGGYVVRFVGGIGVRL